MGINSRQTYRLLKEVAQPWFKGAGFCPNGKSGLWVRPHDDNLELRLAFQCDKNGRDWSGGRFTFNFYLSNKNGEAPLALDCRYDDLLEASDVSKWIELTNRVIAKLRDVEQPPLYDWEETASRDYELRPVDHFSSVNDPWLRFYDEEDVREWWTKFFEPRMDRLLKRFFELGGAEPTPDYPPVNVPSLDVVQDDEGYAVLLISRQDGEALGRELERVHDSERVGLIAWHSDATYVFDMTGRNGHIGDHRLGLHQHRRVWGQFSKRALRELIDVLRCPDNGKPTTLRESARVRVFVGGAPGCQ